MSGNPDNARDAERPHPVQRRCYLRGVPDDAAIEHLLDCLGLDRDDEEPAAEAGRTPAAHPPADDRAPASRPQPEVGA